MAYENETDIQCYIQSVMNEKKLEYSLNKKNISLAYHHVKHTVLAMIMIAKLTTTQNYLA